MKLPALRNAALLVVSTGLALAVSELVARALVPSRATAGELELFEFDPRLGWRFAPNREARVRIPDGHETIVRINEHGMRDRSHPLERRPGARRIAMVGDSFLVGLGVDDADLLTSRIEEWLEPGTEVLNFGVSGYGPIQEFVLVEDQVRRFAPDLVILVLYLGNDFEDLDGSRFRTGYERPRGRVVGGRLIVDDWPEPPKPTDRLLFSLWKFRVYEIAARAARRAADGAREDERLRRWPTTAEVALMRGVIGETARRVSAFSGDFLVVAVPSMTALDGRVARGGEPGDEAAAARAVADICAGAGVAFLDLSATFAERASAGVGDYFAAYRHWNAQGHGAAAAAIGGFLRERE